MSTNNSQAMAIVADLGLSHEQVAQYLNVTTDVVDRWFGLDGSNEQEDMPDSELNFLKYCLMTDNKRSHLF
jgi:hypothetical protein